MLASTDPVTTIDSAKSTRVSDAVSTVIVLSVLAFGVVRPECLSVSSHAQRIEIQQNSVRRVQARLILNGDMAPRTPQDFLLAYMQQK